MDMSHPVSPLVARVPPSVSELKDRAWRNLLKLTATFFLIFCPFLSLQNLESSLQNKGGLGALANATIYCSIAIFSPFAPLVVCNKHVGPKRAIVASAIAYTVFSAANLFPHRYTLLPAAALLGSAASVLWVSQATYLMSVSAMNACATATHFATALSRFNSIFWGVFQTAGVMGNLFAWGLIHLEGEDFKRATYSDLSQDSDFEGQPLGRSKFHLTIAFTSLSGMGILMACMLMELPASTATAKMRLGGGGVEGFCMGMDLRSIHALILLLPLMFWSGVQQAFAFGDFTKFVVEPSLGTSYVAGCMAMFYAADAVASVIAARLATSPYNISAVILFGLGLQGGVLLQLLYRVHYRQDLIGYVTLFVDSAVWGIGDAVCNTQITAVLGLIYPQNTEAAFAAWKMLQAVSTSAAFFAVPPNIHLELRTKVLIMLFIVAVSMVAYLALAQNFLCSALGFGCLTPSALDEVEDEDEYIEIDGGERTPSNRSADSVDSPSSDGIPQLVYQRNASLPSNSPQDAPPRRTMTCGR